MIHITNEEFLRGIFGDDYIWSHVTSFPDPPDQIPDNRRARCWGGGWFKDTLLQPNENTYYTVSTFYADADGKARRRKNLFRCTHIICLDDVREKLPIEQVLRLPPPSYKLATSPGSEQWGYCLLHVCTDMAQVDNLHDGLISKGLAPNNRDPGQKGVTRYVRTPVGVNTKASRVAANGGVPPACQLLEWHPERRYEMEQLASVFSIDLTAERRDARVDGAADVGDHPLLQHVHVKEILSPGRFDITCPWVSGHTNEANDGAAIFTNQDGSIGFKCMHGSCQDRTGKDLLDRIEESTPGFRQTLKAWQTLRAFEAITGATPAPAPAVSFLHAPVEATLVPVDPTYQDLLDRLKTMPPGLDATIEAAYQVIDLLEGMDAGRRLMYQDQLREHLHWTKQDLARIIDDRRKRRREALAGGGDLSFFAEEVYIGEQNQFYNRALAMWRTPEGFQNAYCHLDADARTNALTGQRCRKVDKVDFAPGEGETWRDEYGALYINSWTGLSVPPVVGDVSPWLNHFDRLGWVGDAKAHILQWMAYTLRHPERKINHILLLAGGEGCGKDFILKPLVMAMGRYAKLMGGDEFLEGFNEYLLGTKYLQVNESEHGDHAQATTVYNKIKPLACHPPDKLPVNVKNCRRMEVRNVVNVAMTSNSAMPVKVSQDTRRFYALWTDVTERQLGGRSYWPPLWEWITTGGWQACAHYLMTQVDLSNFDPGAVPEPTDFLHEMREHSEDPVAARIKRLVADRVSVFSADLVTMDDIVNMLQWGRTTERVPTPQVLGKIIKQTGIAKRLPAKYVRDGEQKDLQIFPLRDHDKYAALGRTALAAEYFRQQAVVASNSALTVVHGGKV